MESEYSALRDSIEILSSNLLREDDSFDGRTFLRGEIRLFKIEHMSDIIRYFPKLFSRFSAPGHDVHVEDKSFSVALNRFLFNS